MDLSSVYLPLSTWGARFWGRILSCMSSPLTSTDDNPTSVHLLHPGLAAERMATIDRPPLSSTPGNAMVVFVFPRELALPLDGTADP